MSRDADQPESQTLIEEGDLWQDEDEVGHLRAPVLDYRRSVEYFSPLDTPERWNRYRAFLQRSWFREYLDGLRRAGYDHDGLFESYTVGSFRYCHDTEGFGGFDGDDWWSGHRSNIRIVAVHGHSVRSGVPRPRNRIRYHGSSLVYEFGERPDSLAWDKGHYIAHSMGGATDNGMFAQRRDVNQSRSPLGKRYRLMERYALAHPNTFVFSRPIYGDGTEHPFLVEYGVLKEDRDWWIETFPNRYLFVPFRGFEHAPVWRRKLIPAKALNARFRIVD